MPPEARLGKRAQMRSVQSRTLLAAIAMVLLWTQAPANSEARGSDVVKEKLSRTPTVAQFTRRWRATPLQQQETPGGRVEQKVLERVIRLGDGSSYGIGTITYASVPKRKGAPEDSYSAKLTAERLFTSMKIQDVRHRSVERGVEVYEGVWSLGGRFVRLMIHQTKERFSVSTGVFRLAYLDSVAAESEWIQRNLAHAIKPEPGWMKWILSETTDWLFPEAVAQVGNCPACAPGSSPWMAAQCAACSQGQLLQAIGGINQTLNQGIGQVASANSNWAQTNQQLAAFNQNWSDSNQLLAQALDPGSMFAVGLATGAGAAAGAAAVSLLTSGFSLLASTIYEAVTHEQRDAALLKAFDDAMATYEKIGPKIRETEAYIDSALSILRMAREAGGKEALIQHFDERIRLAETLGSLSREAERRAIGSGASSACQAELNRNGARFDSLVRDMGRLRNRLEETDAERLCADLETQIRTILQAEQTLAEARARILHPLTNRIVSEAQEKKYQEALKLAQEANKPAELLATRNASIHTALESYQRGIDAAPGLRRKMEVARAKCLSDMAEAASGAASFFSKVPIIGPLVQSQVYVEYRPGKTMSSVYYCQAQAEDPDSEYASEYRTQLVPHIEAKRARIVAADSLYQQALRGSGVALDPTTYSAATGAHLEFLATLREQASHGTEQTMRIEALLKKQGDIRAVCPSISQGFQ